MFAYPERVKEWSKEPERRQLNREETAEQRGKSGDPARSAMSTSSIVINKDTWENYQTRRTSTTTHAEPGKGLLHGPAN